MGGGAQSEEERWELDTKSESLGFGPVFVTNQLYNFGQVT